MHVTNSEIRLDVTLGLLLKAFKAKIAGHIERHFDELMASGKKRAKRSASRK